MAGLMVWTLDFDDFLGTVCEQAYTYPLLRAINKVVTETKTRKFRLVPKVPLFSFFLLIDLLIYRLIDLLIYLCSCKVAPTC